MAFYGNKYSSYESEREVDSYSSGYNTYNSGYANSGYPMNQRRHNMVSDVVYETDAVIPRHGRHNMVSDVVCETDVVIPRHGRHHHGGDVEYIERDERIVYESDSYADPCRVRRPYC